MRTLTETESKRLTDELWQASDRLKWYDERKKQRTELNELDIQLCQATLEHLEAQKCGQSVPLDAHAEISRKRQRN